MFAPHMPQVHPAMPPAAPHMSNEGRSPLASMMHQIASRQMAGKGYRPTVPGQPGTPGQFIPPMNAAPAKPFGSHAPM